MTWRPALALLAACLAVYGRWVPGADFIHDDRWIIQENALLRGGWSAAPAVAATGYWEQAQGSAAPVSELRPLLMLSFLGQSALFGMRAAPMRAANLLIHFLAGFLVLKVLSRRFPADAALAGALLFAVLGVHVEAAAALTGRSELLSAAFILGAWLLLEDPVRPRAAGGVLLFLMGAFTKEHTFLFPFFLALGDWVFHGLLPWSARRRGVYAGLAGAGAAALAVRLAVLDRPFHGGAAYFAATAPLDAVLTWAKFFALHYAVPAAAATEFCSDFTRPLIPDSGPGDAAAWACLAALILAGGSILYGLARRRPWSFWAAGPALFLLPTTHLVVSLDTIGAERFLYFPALALCAGLAGLYRLVQARSKAAALAGAGLLILWQGWSASARAKTWNSSLDYYRAAVSCNPGSARAHSALGAELLSGGDDAQGVRLLERSISLNPKLSHPHYNLALRAWERGNKKEAEARLKNALERDPSSADYWVLWGVIQEGLGRPGPARQAHERALALRPWDERAHYNLARLSLLEKKPVDAAEHLDRFLKSAPQDPMAPWARNTLNALLSPPLEGR